MARGSQEGGAVELRVTKVEAQEKIEQRIVKGNELKQMSIRSEEELKNVRNEYFRWDSYNTDLLENLFSTTKFSAEYSRSSSAGLFLADRIPSLSEKVQGLYADVDKKIYRLSSVLERLELVPVSQHTAKVTGQSTAAYKNKKVFVVHGHDETAKTNLEIFLREIGLEPIVLHRQADEGLTVIEKFEKHSEVGYAFILLTPDEIAYLATEEAKEDSERKKEYRARPNVVFEFGYFVGKLGRRRVCCLYTGDVTLPSDVSGMIYKKFNSKIEEIAYPVMKDLRAVGYEV